MQEQRAADAKSTKMFSRHLPGLKYTKTTIKTKSKKVHNRKGSKIVGKSIDYFVFITQRFLARLGDLPEEIEQADTVEESLEYLERLLKR